MPDHPDILQNDIWQQHDPHPHFPELKKFLDFWTRELDGPARTAELKNKSAPGSI
jgi:uncharacterized protein Usg